jgi:hypothetical protein
MSFCEKEYFAIQKPNKKNTVNANNCASGYIKKNNECWQTVYDLNDSADTCPLDYFKQQINTGRNGENLPSQQCVHKAYVKTSEEQCIPGYAQPSDNDQKCNPCMNNTYKENTGNGLCTRCLTDNKLTTYGKRAQFHPTHCYEADCGPRCGAQPSERM